MRIILGLCLLDAVDVHRDYVADDRRFDYVAIFEAIFGAALVGQIRKLAQRAVPPDNLHVRRLVAHATGEALIPGGPVL